MVDIIVTTLDDENDRPTSLVEPGGNGMSLRDALYLSSATGYAGYDRITFAPELSGGTIRLDDILVNDSGALTVIDGDIDGDGRADITVSGENINANTLEGSAGFLDDGERRLLVNLTNSSDGLVLQNINLINGSGDRRGGVIDNRGDLTLNNVTISDSQANSRAYYSGYGIYGGGDPNAKLIRHSGGELTLKNVLFDGNTITHDDTNFTASVSPIYATSGATVSLTHIGSNNTISSVQGQESIFLRKVGGEATEIAGILGVGPDAYAATLNSSAINISSSGPVVGSARFGLSGTNDADQLGDPDGEGGASVAFIGFDGDDFFGGGFKNDVFKPGLGTNTIINERGGDDLVFFDGALSTFYVTSENGRITLTRGAEQTTVSGVNTFSFDDDAYRLTETEVLARSSAYDDGFVVTTLTDIDGASSGLSLREAIELANIREGADTITFADGLEGLIRLSNASLLISDDVTIDGGGRITITGDVLENDVVVGGLTDVKQTYEEDAAYDDDADKALYDNVLIFSISESDVTFRGLTLTGGVRTGEDLNGGAITSYNGAVTIEDSFLSGNAVLGRGGSGGAVATLGDLTITNSTIADNLGASGFNRGAGVIVENNGTVSITDSTIAGNEITGDNGRGGGLHVSGDATITRSTISSNRVTGEDAIAGGVYASDLTLDTTTISGNAVDSASTDPNQAAGYGGAVGVTVEAFFSTITGNTASGAGSLPGGIGAFTNLTLSNSIVLGNLANGANDEYLARETLTVLGNSIAGFSPTAGRTSFDNGDLIFVTDAAQVFADVVDNGGVASGALADNGGPVETIALAAREDNPALDATGENTFFIAGAMDATGRPRPVDQVGVGGPGAGDLGAFELQDQVFSGPVIEGDLTFVAAENQTAIADINAVDDRDAEGDGLVFSLSGEDANLLSINAATGVLSFVAAPDFEAPADSNADNVLTAQVTVTDSLNLATSAGITVTVTDVNEPVDGGDPGDDDGNDPTSPPTPPGDDQPPVDNDPPVDDGPGDDDDDMPDTPVVGPTNGDDNLTGTAVADVISALLGNDTITGLGGADTLNGDGGADVIIGNGGRDVLSGGGGKDSLVGGGGRDSLTGNGGRDTLEGSGGRDVLDGGGGRDALDGGGGKDFVDGGGGRDVVTGGGGADTVTGGRGRDELTGGNGRDVFQFTRGDGRDEITDFRQNQDRIEILDGAEEFDDLTITEAGDNVLIAFANVRITVLDDDEDNFTAADFIF